MSNLYCIKGDILYTKDFGSFETIDLSPPFYL